MMDRINYPFLRAVQLILLAALLSACSSAGKRNLVVSESEYTTVIPTVPVIEQRTKECGAASLAMVFNHLGADISADTLNQSVYTPGKEGTLPIDLILQSRVEGFIPYKINGEIEAIISEIDAGNPVLVLENLGYTWYPNWHFSVVVGYNLPENVLVLHSGKNRPRIVSLTAFENTWGRADNWGIVIVSPGKTPITAEPALYLEAVSAIQKLHPHKARQSYAAALERWPQNPQVDAIARLGIFEHYYASGHYSKATEWMLKGNGPVLPSHWNNLAFSLARMSCMADAMQAIDCAIRLDPDNAFYRNSKKELQNWSTEPSLQNSPAMPMTCEIPRCTDGNSTAHSL